MLEKAAMFWKL